MSYVYSSSDHASFAAVGIFLLAVGLPFGLCCFGSPLAGGDFIFGYPHKVEGVVVNEPTTRYIRTESGGQEKVALTLKVERPVPDTLAVGVSSGDLFVECLSTRCTQIKKGERHAFVCRGIGRFLEPNVVECKHVQKL